MNLVLGSSSPHRLTMLAKITSVKPIVISPEIDETPFKGEIPREYAARMARGKLEKVISIVRQDTKLAESSIIICADTVCARGRLILPKAENDADVKMCMEMLSGRNHDVFTAISAVNLQTGQYANKISSTKIKFKHLNGKDVEGMINSKDGIGKAGGYTINGFAESFIIQINGSYSGVVGLNLYHARNILKTFNCPYVY